MALIYGFFTFSRQKICKNVKPSAKPKFLLMNLTRFFKYKALYSSRLKHFKKTFPTIYFRNL